MDTRDDQTLLLFTCGRCGFWPMAYQSENPFGKDKVFTCPRCHEHTAFTVGGTRVDSLPGSNEQNKMAG